ncbi:hypothetical protein EG328_004700 [Venturia inaequalis]|uniref:AAA+ ATPase domain-containing protein n=1 Tax=Venturia inaequalis TaxID=5025 RepID=A0A8H3UNZ8_VENIN|nr:hypothetical protein EG328_004700 [Venturia inaequalis]
MDKAVASLQHSHNDVERAKRHHDILDRYLGGNRPSASTFVSYRSQGQLAGKIPSFSDGSVEDINMDYPSGNEGSLSGAPSTDDEMTYGSGIEADEPHPALHSIEMETHPTKPDGPKEAVSEQRPLPGTPEETGFEIVSHAKTKIGEREEWDFMLPRVVPQHILSATFRDINYVFDVLDLVGALQRGASLEQVRGYLERFDRSNVKKRINDEVEGFPAMFYVVEANNEPLVRLWVAYGGNPEAMHTPSNTPLLAFAIVNGETIKKDTTLITSTLLSLGAAPNVIPSAFYSPYLRDLPENGPDAVHGDTDDEKERRQTSWYVGAARTQLARSITLSQRYYLDKASKTKTPLQRHVQLAQRRNAAALLGLPYFLIGQTLASSLLLSRLLSHLISPSKRPLVLVFAGPSGHGKTELARKLGHLLSLDLEVVDCTIFNREMELFGAREPFVGSEKGSPLNNFLANNAGKRCIVFLDEFEKTTSDIHKTLLLPFDNGEYQDRRTRETIDCSKTIWILATNAHDHVIKNFYRRNEEALCAQKNETEQLKLIKLLSAAIKQDFLTRFESPITGRVSGFIPFLPFSLGEQAVVVHKYLLELSSNVQGAVDLSFGPQERLLGNLRIRMHRDASLCKHVAEVEYHSDLGARSLINGVDSIKNLVVQAYLDVDEEIVESPHQATCYIDINDDDEIAVKIAAPSS